MDVKQRRSLGQVLRTLREAQGLTRPELSERTADGTGAVSVEMIAKIEQGAKAPSASTLKRLAHALDIDPTAVSERANAWQLAEEQDLSRAVLRNLALGSGIASGFALGSAVRPPWVSSATLRAIGLRPGAARGGGWLPVATAAVGVSAVIAETVIERRAKRARERLAALSDEQIVAVALELGLDDDDDPDLPAEHEPRED